MVGTTHLLLSSPWIIFKGYRSSLVLPACDFTLRWNWQTRKLDFTRQLNFASVIISHSQLRKLWHWFPTAIQLVKTLRLNEVEFTIAVTCTHKLMSEAKIYLRSECIISALWTVVVVLIGIAPWLALNANWQMWIPSRSKSKFEQNSTGELLFQQH